MTTGTATRNHSRLTLDPDTGFNMAAFGSELKDHTDSGPTAATPP